MNRAQTRKAVKSSGKGISPEEIYRLLRRERKDSIDQTVHLYSVAMVDVLHYKANLDRDTIIMVLENVQQTMDCINSGHVNFAELEQNICQELNMEIRNEI